MSDINLGEVGFGVYHSNKFGGLQINGAAGFSNMDVDVTRAVTLGSNQQQFKSNADGKRFYANLQAVPNASEQYCRYALYRCHSEPRKN
ncbi:autotransporter domain-containing protein [Psychrobacter sp. JCM 18901]|uniref:autotransporter domain-containing protein n=1 Tax=Psychrobacter sp. JCM 18901 TaxID=1298609 RepID=UPI0004AD9AEA|nr:autotransporter domain-containing protein [Psychrobacter sp. JCM 18901]